jgi:hypothetical protein
MVSTSRSIQRRLRYAELAWIVPAQAAEVWGASLPRFGRPGTLFAFGVVDLPMPHCQVQQVSPHSFPKGPASVEGRRMSLDTACREDAVFSAKLLSTVGGRGRKGAVAKEFLLCENHSQLVSQIDRELIEEGWSTVFVEKLRPLV